MCHCLEFYFFLVVNVIVVICDCCGLVIDLLSLATAATPCTCSTILAIGLLHSSCYKNTLFAFATIVTTFMSLLLRFWLMNFLRFDFGPLTVHDFVIRFKINL